MKIKVCINVDDRLESTHFQQHAAPWGVVKIDPYIRSPGWGRSGWRQYYRIT